jgi:hypothetical protein
MFNCDVCGGQFKLIQQQEQKKNGAIRFVLYYACNGCLAGLINYHPFAPEIVVTPIEDDESSKGDAC